MENIQLCWRCKKCTNQNLCKWVEGILPEYVTLNEENFIVKCENFEKDDLEHKGKYALAEEEAKKLGISIRTYFRKINGK